MGGGSKFHQNKGLGREGKMQQKDKIFETKTVFSHAKIHDIILKKFKKFKKLNT